MPFHRRTGTSGSKSREAAPAAPEPNPAAERRREPPDPHARTPQRRKEDPLRDADEQLSGILAITGEAIITADERQRIVLFKRGAEAIFGYTAAEAEGQPLEVLLPERFRAGHRRSMEAADVRVAERHIRRAVEMGADLVVIDTPPALGPITTASIRASRLVVIPAMPGKESLERSHDVISLARACERVPAVRILLTLAHLQSNLFRWMVEQVDALYPGARMRPVIPYEMPAGEAALFEVPVTVSAPKSRSSLA